MGIGPARIVQSPDLDERGPDLDERGPDFDERSPVFGDGSPVASRFTKLLSVQLNVG